MFHQLSNVHLAAAFDEGGVLLHGDDAYTPFADGLFDPQIAFTRGGVLVAADGRIGRTYRIDSGKPRWRGDFTSPGPSLLAITPTTQLDEFATFTMDGKVTVYKLPAA